jgi:hypothetical protein
VVATLSQPVAALIEFAPDWAACSPVHINRVDVDAAALRASGRPTRLYRLEVAYDGREIVAKERAGNGLLPGCCPERHVNVDASFCLGLRAGEGIADEGTASGWWEKLKLFLVCQDTADETGRWPHYAQLSHGEAGEMEARAELASRSIGLLPTYREAVERNSGPIASSLNRVVKPTGRLRNGRAACLCGRVGKRGRAVLRRDCRKLGCPVELEFARRQATALFWESMKGRACCGSMIECPLRSAPTVGSASEVAARGMI